MCNAKGDLLFCGVIIGIPDCPAPQGHHHPGPKQLSEIGSICVHRFLHLSLYSTAWFAVGNYAGWSWICETVLCWRVINTGAIKPEEVTVHWSSTQGTRRTIWCTCPPTPVCYPLVRNLNGIIIYATLDTQNMNRKRFYTHGWLF